MDAAVIAAFTEPTGVITYQPQDGAAVPVEGIFDAAYVRAAIGEAGIASVGPSVWFRVVDLPVAHPEADEPVITVNGVPYSAREIKPDGLGGVRLFLWKNAT